MRVILKSRHNTHFATGEYDGNRLTVFPGSRINPILSYTAMPESVKEVRNNRDLVSAEGVVLKDVVFNSPSAAAEFVTGRSVNGYVSWRIDDKISLKVYRAQNS